MCMSLYTHPTFPSATHTHLHNILLNRNPIFRNIHEQPDWISESIPTYMYIHAHHIHIPTKITKQRRNSQCPKIPAQPEVQYHTTYLNTTVP